jgi:hypothetical protein
MKGLQRPATLTCPRTKQDHSFWARTLRWERSLGHQRSRRTTNRQSRPPAPNSRLRGHALRAAAPHGPSAATACCGSVHLIASIPYPEGPLAVIGAVPNAGQRDSACGIAAIVPRAAQCQGFHRAPLARGWRIRPDGFFGMYAPVFGLGNGTPYEAATWQNDVAGTAATPVILSPDLSGRRIPAVVSLPSGRPTNCRDASLRSA